MSENTYPDLVSRLRDLGGYIDQKVGEYAIEAAEKIEELNGACESALSTCDRYYDEIERLNGLNDYLQGLHDALEGDYVKAITQRQTAEAENNRLSEIVHDEYRPSTWADLKNCPCTDCRGKLTNKHQ